MKNAPTNSTILNANPGPLGFISDNEMTYAAVPWGTSDKKLAIIHDGKILKICRNRQSALNYIARQTSKRKTN